MNYPTAPEKINCRKSKTEEATQPPRQKLKFTTKPIEPLAKTARNKIKPTFLNWLYRANLKMAHGSTNRQAFDRKLSQ